MPGAVAAAGGEERVDRVAAEVRAHGQRIRERRRPPPRGSRNAAAYARAVEPMSPPLAVGDHEQARLARVRAHRLEGPPPVAAERLEERGLRLDRDDVRRDGVDDPFAEALDRVAAAARRRPAPRRAAPRAAGRRRGRGPTTSCDRLRSTASASRSANGAVRSACGGVARHAAKGSPLHHAREWRRARAPSTRSSGGGRRRNDATSRSSSVSSGPRATRSRARASATQRLHLGEPRPARAAPGAPPRPVRRRSHTPRTKPGSPAGTTTQARSAAQPLQLAQRLDRLLERGEPVAQARRVLEALLASRVAGAAPRSGGSAALDVVRLVTRRAPARRVWAAPFARERTERRRLGRDAPACPAAPRGRRGGRVACRARSPAAEAPGAAGAPRAPPRAPTRSRATRPARARRARPRRRDAGARRRSTSAAARAARGRGRRRAPCPPAPRKR